MTKHQLVAPAAVAEAYRRPLLAAALQGSILGSQKNLSVAVVTYAHAWRSLEHIAVAHC